jgi:tetratricopeptide (TPR) repeat protein
MSTKSGSAVVVDDSDDDVSVHSVSKRVDYALSVEEAFSEEVIEQLEGGDHDMHYERVEALTNEYKNFEEHSDHWKHQHVYDHHHIDEILTAHITEEHAGRVLLHGIDIAEKWGNMGLLALYKGQYMLRDKLYDQAASKFEEALEYYRDRLPSRCEQSGEMDLTPHLHSLLIECYHEQNMLPRAMSVAREWIGRYPMNPSPHAALAFIQREQQQWTDSIQTCSAAIDKLPETEQTMTLIDIRGNNYYTLGNYEQAASDFSRVKALSQKSLARFAVDKPKFLAINDYNPRLVAPIQVPRGRPDILKRQKEEGRRIMELYSLYLSENPAVQPQTSEELMATKGILSRAQTPSRMESTSTGFFKSLLHTARVQMREEARRKNKVETQNYEIHDDVGRFCAMCHGNASSMDKKRGSGPSKTRKAHPHPPLSPKRLMHGLNIGQQL